MINKSVFSSLQIIDGYGDMSAGTYRHGPEFAWKTDLVVGALSIDEALYGFGGRDSTESFLGIPDIIFTGGVFEGYFRGRTPQTVIRNVGVEFKQFGFILYIFKHHAIGMPVYDHVHFVEQGIILSRIVESSDELYVFGLVDVIQKRIGRQNFKGSVCFDDLLGDIDSAWQVWFVWAWCGRRGGGGVFRLGLCDLCHIGVISACRGTSWEDQREDEQA